MWRDPQATCTGSTTAAASKTQAAMESISQTAAGVRSKQAWCTSQQLRHNIGCMLVVALQLQKMACCSSNRPVVPPSPTPSLWKQQLSSDWLRNIAHQLHAPLQPAAPATLRCPPSHNHSRGPHAPTATAGTPTDSCLALLLNTLLGGWEPSMHSLCIATDALSPDPVSLVSPAPTPAAPPPQHPPPPCCVAQDAVVCNSCPPQGEG